MGAVQKWRLDWNINQRRDLVVSRRKSGVKRFIEILNFDTLCQQILFSRHSVWATLPKSMNWMWYKVDRSTNTQNTRNWTKISNYGAAIFIFIFSSLLRGEKLDLIKDPMILIPYWDKSNFIVQKEGEILIINYLLWPFRIAVSKYVQFMFV